MGVVRRVGEDMQEAFCRFKVILYCAFHILSAFSAGMLNFNIYLLMHETHVNELVLFPVRNTLAVINGLYSDQIQH